MMTKCKGLKLSQEKVREFFNYSDGQLIWKVNRYKAKIGDIAGWTNKRGYTQISIGGRNYFKHRLIFLWHHGYFPENYVDHIDRNLANNRIENLREVSHSCNLRNTGNHKDNSSGIKGVVWYKEREKWMAHIFVNNKLIHLGITDCLLEAACLRLAAEQSLNWSECDSTSPAYKYVKKHILTKK